MPATIKGLSSQAISGGGEYYPGRQNFSGDFMSARFTAITAAIVLTLLPYVAIGETTQRSVSRIAFDPSIYFQKRDIGDVSRIRVVYTGDDYGWPVYAFAIADGCAASSKAFEGCALQLIARMVRSPAPPNMVRPRDRGHYLVQQIQRRELIDDSAIRSSLLSLGVEWMEADLTVCPGANELLASATDLDWVPEGIVKVSERRLVTLVMHADMLQVSFGEFRRTSTYYGYAAPGSPAEWAVAMAQTLEPCWKPASTPPPWSTELSEAK